MKNEMGGECERYGEGEDRSIQHFGGKDTGRWEHNIKMDLNK
jgi:hypothetical protein